MHELRATRRAVLLELGRGFCFEARQRRILIGGEYFFVDLVFYHRILKCHVLIELKSEGFTHEYLGQLNTYVSWYHEHEMSVGDNPPIGILLCTEKSHVLVKYALAATKQTRRGEGRKQGDPPPGRPDSLPCVTTSSKRAFAGTTTRAGSVQSSR